MRRLPRAFLTGHHKQCPCRECRYQKALRIAWKELCEHEYYTHTCWRSGGARRALDKIANLQRAKGGRG
jgi:hypothetical protein